MSNRNIVKHTTKKTVRKTLPSGEVQETTVIETQAPPTASSSSLQRPSGGIPRIGSGIPRQAGGIPRPTAGIPRPSGGIPRSAGATPKPPGGIPRPPGGIPRPPGGIPRQTGGIPRAAGANTRKVTSKTTVINPDGTKSISTKTRITKDPSIPGINVEEPSMGPPSLPAPSQDRRFLQPPSAVAAPPRPAADAYAPSYGTGAVRRTYRPPAIPGASPPSPSRITRRTKETEMDESGRVHKRSKTTISTRGGERSRSPAGPEERPSDMGGAPEREDPMSLSPLERQVNQELLNMSRTSGYAQKASAASERVAAPTMMTPSGPVPVEKQVIIESKMEKSRQGEQIRRHIITSERQPDNMAERIELAGQSIQPLDFSAAAGEMGISPRDVISMRSTVSIGGGMKETTTKVIYETDREDETGGQQLSAEQASKLVEEENQELEEVLKLIPPTLDADHKDYPLRKKTEILALSAITVDTLERVVEMPPPNADEEVPELQPELIAAIMHTEEAGIPIESKPNQVYDYLFPEDKVEKFANASSAAPAVVQDVIIPLSLPPRMEASAMSDQLEAIVAMVQSAIVQPSNSIFADTTKSDRPKVNNFAKPKRKKIRTPISEETPPWDIEDMQVIADLVGADPASPLVEEELEMTLDKDPRTHGIDVMLELQGPRHVSKVQLRGSQNPPWFPGYVVALPTISDLVRIERSPNTVITSAWRAVQPNLFSDDSFLFV